MTKAAARPIAVRRRDLTLAQVRRHERYATCRTKRGAVFEYVRGCIYVTDREPKGRYRERVTDGRRIPKGPWYHHSLCDCGFCRAEY